MRNIHIIPTDKPSRLFKDDFGRLIYSINIDQEQNHFEPQNIYITSDEEIKEGDYYIDYSIKTLVEIHKLKVKFGSKPIDCKKIILTTDTDLISDGVQAIPDEFLEWFVNNPSCEEVEVKRGYLGMGGFVETNEPLSKDKIEYKIIIPKEEPKETLEEAALKYSDGNTLEFAYMQEIPAFKAGAEWQAERMYSEEEVLEIIALFVNDSPHNTKEWFEQFQKK